MSKEFFIDTYKRSSFSSVLNFAYEFEEREFYGAYKRHLVGAKAIMGTDIHLSYHLLCISIECFFKDIFCLYRYKTIGNLKDFKIQDHLKHSLLYTNKDVTDYLTRNLYAKERFNHNISVLVRFVVGNLVNPQRANDLLQFTNYLPNGKDWINNRYRNKSSLNSKINPQRLTEFLSIFENTVLGDIFKEFQ